MAESIPSSGTEIQFVLDGQVLRGWIVSQEAGEVGIYPQQGDSAESCVWPVAECQILDSQEPLQGWEALRLEGNHDQDPIEVRFRKEFMDGLRQDAILAGVSVEELVVDYLRAGLQDARDL